MPSNGCKPVLCPHGILGKGKCRSCKNARQAKWASEHREYKRAKARESLGIPVEGGITKEGCCPLCDRIRKLVPDHNHETGRLRDWICRGCNLRLGVFENMNIKRFSIYIQKHEEADNA